MGGGRTTVRRLVPRARALPARLVRAELALWRSLWWAVRRRREVAPGQAAFSCTSRVGVMLWATIALTPIEIVAVHLLLPWQTVRVVVLVLSVVSLVWMVGFAFGLQQRPHVLDGERLVVRFGTLREAVVRVADVLDARAATTVDHRKNLEVTDGQVALSVLGESSVRLRLRPGATVELDGRPVPAERVLLFADDPRAVVRALRAPAAESAA